MLAAGAVGIGGWPAGQQAAVLSDPTPSSAGASSFAVTSSPEPDGVSSPEVEPQPPTRTGPTQHLIGDGDGDGMPERVTLAAGELTRVPSSTGKAVLRQGEADSTLPGLTDLSGEGRAIVVLTSFADTPGLREATVWAWRDGGLVAAPGGDGLWLQEFKGRMFWIDDQGRLYYGLWEPPRASDVTVSTWRLVLRGTEVIATRHQV